MPRKMLPRYRFQGPALPCVNEKKFYLAPEGPDWIIQRSILRRHECIIHGPSLKAEIEPVGAADLRSAVQAVLREWWRPMLHQPERLHAPGYQPYAVVSMCRALYTLQHGVVASKRDAAFWAMEGWGAQWRKLIEEALGWRQGNPNGDISQTLAFMRYTLDRTNLEENS